MCQTYFSGAVGWHHPPTSYLRNRGVVCTKRRRAMSELSRAICPPQNESGSLLSSRPKTEEARWKRALCHHGLSTPRGPIIMTLCPPAAATSSARFTCPGLSHPQSQNQTSSVGHKLSPRIYFGEASSPLHHSKTNHFADMARSIYFKPVDHGCLTRRSAWAQSNA